MLPFFFSIVAEGLTGLVRSATVKGIFKGFCVNEFISFPILQFANDTIMMCDASYANLWAIKAILRSFELASGLRVNYSKSNLYGINLDDRFLHVASDFLACCIGQLPFKFLGIPIAANPRKYATWEPVIAATRRKLSCWKGRFLSIGGRMTLINSVLNSLPLYFFSFYKAPKRVIKSLVAIQRNFLWGDKEDSKTINWVRWSKVCLPKK